ncbi:MAG: hypothetical protein IJK89_05440 [Clostridia bacterium]|nr:hypothetical protein [Clostridia bacterium]
MQRTKRAIALLLVLVLILPTLAACGKKQAGESEESPITATDIQYSKRGVYTTTVSSEKVDLSGITAGDVLVFYEEATGSSDNLLTEEMLLSAIREASDTEVKTRSRKTSAVILDVDSVQANPNGGYDISFTDEDALNNPTDTYRIEFKGTDAMATVSVVYPEISLTPDVAFVTAADRDYKITLTLAGSDFEDEIDPKSVYLGDAFRDLEIKSLSSSGKNLTMQLAGSLAADEAGLCRWGTIGVNPRAIRDGYTYVTARVNVCSDAAYLDYASMRYDAGRVTAELKVYGAADPASLTKENVRIDGAVTESVEQLDAHTVNAVFSAEGIGSVNDFSDRIGDGNLTVGAYTAPVGLFQASFYPVFDYAEDDGENLKLTLKLYADNGTFDEKLSADGIALGKGFDTAKIESVAVDDDTVATLVVSTPANGKTSEDMDITGTVTLPAGALTNAWGEKTSQEVSYTRGYSTETLGRDITLNTETLLEIQRYTRGLNTLFGKVIYYGKAAGATYSFAKTVLEAVGVLKSEHQEIMEELAAIRNDMQNIQSDIKEVKQMLRVSESNEIQIKLSPYEEKLKALTACINDITSTYRIGMLDMALLDAKADGRIAELPRYTGMDDAQVEVAMEEYRELYLPNVEDMTDSEAADYNERLVNFILREGEDVTKTQYTGFKGTVEKLNSLFSLICTDLQENESKNPLTYYDEFCALCYNFDSQSYDYRLSQRVLVEGQLERALTLLASYHKVSKNPTNTIYRERKNEFFALQQYLDDHPVSGHPASEIKANPRYETIKNVEQVTVTIDRPCISEIAIAASENYWSPARKALQDAGYEVDFTNLNDHAGNYYVLIGYKTTMNYDEAIKGFLILKDIDTETYITPDENKVKFSLAPYTGDEAFVSSKGNLNIGNDGDNLHLYYTKQDNDISAGKVYYSITANGSTQDAVKDTYGEGGNPVVVNQTAPKEWQLYIKAHPDMAPGVYNYEINKQTYIKDLMVSGSDNQKYAKECLTKKGYTVIDHDLNAGAGGKFIYLGYKTTTNINDAVTDISCIYRIEKASSRRAGLCPCTGDQDFIDSKGDLNCGAGGWFIYLYYYKTPRGDGLALTDLYVNHAKDGCVDGRDLNAFAGGEYLYLHYNLGNGVFKTDNLIDTDAEYYPYCYYLGKKVSYGNSEDYWDFRFLKDGAMKDSDGAYRNWSDEEVREFVRRMHAGNVKAELASAGIDTGSGGLLTKANVKQESVWYNLGTTWNYIYLYGNVIAPDSVRETRFNGEKDKFNYINRCELNDDETWYDSMNKRQAFIFFSLYDAK